MTSRPLTPKLLAPLGNLLGIFCFQLCFPGILLSFQFDHSHMLTREARTLPGSHQGAISLSLGVLGTQDALPSLDDAGIHVVAVAVAKTPVEQAAALAAGTVGRCGADTAPRAAGGGRGCPAGGVVTAPKETVFPGRLVIDGLLLRSRLGVTREESMLHGGFLICRLVLGHRFGAAREETLFRRRFLIHRLALRCWFGVTRKETHGVQGFCCVYFRCMCLLCR